MAHERILQGHQRPIHAGTLLIPYTPVRLAGTSGLLVLPAGTSGNPVFGLTGAATHAAGEPAVVFERGNVVKARACGSILAGAPVMVGTTTGRLCTAAGASGAARYEVGYAEGPANDPEVFAVYLDPSRNGSFA